MKLVMTLTSKSAPATRYGLRLPTRPRAASRNASSSYDRCGSMGNRVPTGAVVVTRWLASLLYDVSPTDPAVLVALPLGLAAISLVACYVPARRAARSDPLAVLRAD